MKKTEQPLRNAEITQDFVILVDRYVDDLLNQKIEKQLSTADFAHLLNIAPRYLSNTLKATMDISPCEIIENRIIHEAKIMLNETTKTIAEISHQFAYQDTTNFIKFFKGMVGLTPLQYRKQQREYNTSV